MTCLYSGVVLLELIDLVLCVVQVVPAVPDVVLMAVVEPFDEKLDPSSHYPFVQQPLGIILVILELVIGDYRCFGRVPFSMVWVKAGR